MYKPETRVSINFDVTNRTWENQPPPPPSKKKTDIYHFHKEGYSSVADAYTAPPWRGVELLGAKQELNQLNLMKKLLGFPKERLRVTPLSVPIN